MQNKGMVPGDKENKKNENVKDIRRAFQMLGFIGGVGLTIAIFIITGVLVGRFIDNRLSTGFVFLLLFTTLNTGFAFYYIYRQIMKRMR